MNERIIIRGFVEKGKQLGRTIGFPTANIRTDMPMEDVPRGVYAAWFIVGGDPLPCMVNIGHHPTVPDGKPTIEAHIFDYSGDLYGAAVALHTVAYLRGEVRFPSLDALQQQLSRDKARSLQILHNENPPGIE